MLNNFEVEIQQDAKTGSTLILHDRNLNKSTAFLVAVEGSAEVFKGAFESVAATVKEMYSPEKQEQAKDVVREFVTHTPEWLRAMELGAVDGHCPACGIKVRKIEELMEALKLIA